MRRTLALSILLGLGQCGALCSSPPMPIGSSGVQTADLNIRYEVVPDGAVLTLTAEATTGPEPDSKSVALEGDDRIFVTVGATTLELTRAGDATGAYRAVTATPEIGTEIVFSLRRGAPKASAPTSRVLFSKPFSITGLTPNAFTPEHTSMLVHTDGIDGRIVDGFLDACTNDTTTHAIPTKDGSVEIDIQYGSVTRPAKCDATLSITVVDRGALDPALAQTGAVEVRRTRSVPVPMIR